MDSITLITDVEEMQKLARAWCFRTDTALVPTMGFLHEGHLSLVRHAAQQASIVIVSIFVNPLQFGPKEDLEKYPRNRQRDLELLEQVGATHVFMPTATDITPENMTFVVDPGSMADVLCGQYRPGHFQGVATIVLKLLMITMPHIAIFGWKDAQQFLILRKMVEDFNIPVTLQALDTQRNRDGLALSSRNTYLSPEENHAALALSRGLKNVTNAYKNGNEKARDLRQILVSEIEAEQILKLQYAQVVAMDTLEPVDIVQPGNTLIALAVYAGETRLIDNIRL